MNTKKLLMMAARISRIRSDNRTFYLGAVAVRDDDVLVYACNGPSPVPIPRQHCESRLVRKLDKGATVYLARTSSNGEWANSKPCPNCERVLRRAKIRRLYYTTGPNQWDTMEFQ